MGRGSVQSEGVFGAAHRVIPHNKKIKAAGAKLSRRLLHSPPVIEKCLKEEKVPDVDERLVRVVHIIVEQYGGDVAAFVDTMRCQSDLIQLDEVKKRSTAGAHHGGAGKH